MELKPAVFFDRDGVLNPLVWHGGIKTAPWTLDEFRIYPGVKCLVTKLKKRGYPVLVATNQPGLARGELSREVYECMCQEVKKLGVDEIFTCEHALDSSCDCRKPKPGLLLAAAKKWGIDLKRSYFLGDNETDLQAAAAVGCNGILLRTTDNLDVSAKCDISLLGLLSTRIP